MGGRKYVDEKNFENFVRRYYDVVVKYIETVYNLRTDADYLANEVFYRIWKSKFDITKIKTEEELWYYLKSVIKTICLNYIRDYCSDNIIYNDEILNILEEDPDVSV